MPSDVASARRDSVSETVCSYAVWNAPTAMRRAFVAAPRGGALGLPTPRRVPTGVPTQLCATEQEEEEKDAEEELRAPVG